MSSVSAQWQKQEVNTDASFRGLDVVSDKVVWASGTGGTVVRTIDGGKNWDVIKVPGAEKLDFRDIEAFDANTAYILSIGNGESSRIYKTNDGGKNWNLQFKNSDEKAFFDSIAFWDKKNGMAQGDPVDGKFVLYHTTDGETWKPVGTDKMPGALEGEAAFAASGTSIITHGKKGIFLITGGTESRVFRSNDRGLTWTASDSRVLRGAPSKGAFGIAFGSKDIGIVVGGDYAEPEMRSGNVSYTSDGGKTWVTKLKIDRFGFRSGVTFINKDTAIVVGTTGTDIT
ncbi:MAG: glycosyl hydrolase, partial [Acidobacteria bacterium]|nr:glycosyl hydrolase [Acidobacteriota bacterium]